MQDNLIYGDDVTDQLSDLSACTVRGCSYCLSVHLIPSGKSPSSQSSAIKASCNGCHLTDGL